MTKCKTILNVYGDVMIRSINFWPVQAKKTRASTLFLYKNIKTHTCIAWYTCTLHSYLDATFYHSNLRYRIHMTVSHGVLDVGLNTNLLNVFIEMLLRLLDVASDDGGLYSIIGGNDHNKSVGREFFNKRGKV